MAIGAGDWGGGGGGKAGVKVCSIRRALERVIRVFLEATVVTVQHKHSNKETNKKRKLSTPSTSPS